MQERLAGTIAPVLSISLDPGESIVAEAGEFSWMSDSIQMSSGLSSVPGRVEPASVPGRGAGAAAPLSTFTAKASAGTIAFASKLPGAILGVDVSPGAHYLIRRRGFLAGTVGVEIRAGFPRSGPDGGCPADGFGLDRVGGAGRAWIELAGQAIRFDLSAGESLRTHPAHVGMFAASVAFQLMRVPGIANRYSGPEAHYFAVLSGPGTAWLQSMPVPLLDPQTTMTMPFHE